MPKKSATQLDREIAEALHGKSLSGLDARPVEAVVAAVRAKYPHLRIPKVVEVDGHGNEASFNGSKNRIELAPKFHAHDAALQEHILVHEIGHSVESKYGLAGLMSKLADEGIDPWDTDKLPFGQFNVTEAFAEAFAVAHTDPSALDKYPAWKRVIEKSLK